MRVIHVVTAFPRTEDDLITPWMVELVREQRRSGIEAEVLAPAYRGSRNHEISGIPVHRFRYAPAGLETLTHDETVPERLIRRPHYGGLLPSYLAGGLRAAAALGRSAPQVVHVHWPMPHALLGATLRHASAGRTAMVCSYYSVELNWVDKKLAWLRPLLRWSIRTADAVTAISSSTASRIQDFVPTPVSVVPFAAAVDLADAPEVRAPFAHDGPVELLFVGRLVERKGVEHLIRALPTLLRDRPVRLTVVGEGSWEPRLRETVRDSGMEEHVRFAGRATDSELRRLYAACDVFVLPAVVDRKGDTEGLGVVLLEALRFGRPVVASELGGIPDIVKPGRSGWLVPPGDPEALARTLGELAAAPEEARRIGRAGREFANERFSWTHLVGKLGVCYEEAQAFRHKKRTREI